MLPARKQRVDIASVLGLLVALGGILAGLVMEGGRLTDVTQLTGALIVLSGTAGAVLITTPRGIVLRALRLSKWIFYEPDFGRSAVLAELLGFSTYARRHGLIALEAALSKATDPFVRKGLMLAIDGIDPQVLRETMELEMTVELQSIRAGARAYEAAGGYAPTIGIIGAVLGLMQVMKNLQEIEKVGHGIAVAFVATVYGVALANLFLLPAGAKIRNRAEELWQLRSMMMDGVCQIAQGTHPKIIERRLSIYSASGDVLAASVPRQNRRASGEKAA